MARQKTRKTRKTGPKRQNLLTARKIKPPTLSKYEIAQYLQIPVKWVKKVAYLPHQVCISWRNRAGKSCSSFFSYRKFGSWQTAVIDRITRSKDLQELNHLAGLIALEYRQFKYPVEMMDAIDEAHGDRLDTLQAVNY